MGGVAMSEERPTLAELAAMNDRANAKRSDSESESVEGKPADICPFCGCAMFVYGTRTAFVRDTRRYVECRNCGEAFESKQPPAVIVRRIERRKDSISGQPKLTIVRESA
jgi:hypothetical protein